MRTSRISWWSAAIAAGTVLLAACASPRVPSGEGASVSWDAMTKPEREAYMRTTVQPRMKAIFMEFDSHRYPKMECNLCHSSDRAVGWKMPNPDLIVEEACISGEADRLYGSEDAAIAMRKMTKFMKERVQPEMARLLGRRTYDCFGCHTKDRPLTDESVEGAPSAEVPVPLRSPSR